MSGNSDECELKGGHPPAVKVGGMRVSQHKTPHQEPQLCEDTTGIRVSSSPPKTMTISGAPAKGNPDFPAEAVRSIHKDKPPAAHPQKPQINIQQPRK